MIVRYFFFTASEKLCLRLGNHDPSYHLGTWCCTIDAMDTGRGYEHAAAFDPSDHGEPSSKG